MLNTAFNVSRWGMVLFLGLILSGCLLATQGGGVRIAVADRPQMTQHPKPGPPPHAKAHGHRYKYRYQYYPEQRTYFDSGRGLYFYLNSDGWQMSVALPRYLQINLGESVSIEMDIDRPYVRHYEHLKKYPPKKFKTKKHKWK